MQIDLASAIRASEFSFIHQPRNTKTHRPCISPERKKKNPPVPSNLKFRRISQSTSLYLPPIHSLFKPLPINLLHTPTAPAPSPFSSIFFFFLKKAVAAIILYLPTPFPFPPKPSPLPPPYGFQHRTFPPRTSNNPPLSHLTPKSQFLSQLCHHYP